MSIVLTAETDPTCRAIANFLAAQIGGLESDQIEIETVLDYDGMVGGAALDFPLLQVYRLGSSGPYLETTTLNIDYYLYSVAALAERPGILRLVESAIAHSITDRLPYSGLSDCVRLRIETSTRSFLRLESGEIFPFVRLTAELQEIDVVTPGVYVPVDLDSGELQPSPIEVSAGLRFYQGSNYVELKPPAELPTSYSFTLPDALPGSTKAIVVDASGQWSYQAIAAVDVAPETAEAVEDIEIGQPLYLNANGTVGLARADHPLKAQVCGFAKTSALATFAVEFVSEGAITRSNWNAIAGAAALTPGAEYFLSATAGQITTISPTSGYVAPIGRALTSTKLDIEIQPIIKL